MDDEPEDELEDETWDEQGLRKRARKRADEPSRKRRRSSHPQRRKAPVLNLPRTEFFCEGCGKQVGQDEPRKVIGKGTERLILDRDRSTEERLIYVDRTYLICVPCGGNTHKFEIKHGFLCVMTAQRSKTHANRLWKEALKRSDRPFGLAWRATAALGLQQALQQAPGQAPPGHPWNSVLGPAGYGGQALALPWAEQLGNSLARLPHLPALPQPPALPTAGDGPEADWSQRGNMNTIINGSHNTNNNNLQVNINFGSSERQPRVLEALQVLRSQTHMQRESALRWDNNEGVRRQGLREVASAMNKTPREENVDDMQKLVQACFVFIREHLPMREIAAELLEDMTLTNTEEVGGCPRCIQFMDRMLESICWHAKQSTRHRLSNPKHRIAPLLDEVLAHTTSSQPKDEVQRGLLLNVVVSQRAAVLQLLAGEDQALLIRRNALLVLDLLLDVLDGVGDSTSSVMVLPVRVLTKICIVIFFASLSFLVCVFFSFFFMFLFFCRLANAPASRCPVAGS